MLPAALTKRSGIHAKLNNHIVAGTIDLDPEESALIVNCFIETTVLQDGEPVSVS
jgi:hypothetical protein